jgi:putative ubiquitin-RnfH superfamily antitoxin RatB of RatAB toxin-antitoxin module
VVDVVVSVAWVSPSVQELVDVEVPAGAPVRVAIERSGLAATYGLDLAALAVAVHGRRATLETPLRDGDRVELLRALVADPRDARRLRAQTKPLARAPPRVKRRCR